MVDNIMRPDMSQYSDSYLGKFKVITPAVIQWSDSRALLEDYIIQYYLKKHLSHIRMKDHWDNTIKAGHLPLWWTYAV